MDTNQIARRSRAAAQRADGWTPEIQQGFIIALIAHGSVQMAAAVVERHVTSAYRLRARDAGFARAWDAARRMAYARLRDEAMDRALNGTEHEVWRDGACIGTKRVHNDRLLIALLNHLQHEASPRAASAGVADIDSRCSDEAAHALALLAPHP